MLQFCDATKNVRLSDKEVHMQFYKNLNYCFFVLDNCQVIIIFQIFDLVVHLKRSKLICTHSHCTTMYILSFLKKKKCFFFPFTIVKSNTSSFLSSFGKNCTEKVKIRISNFVSPP